MVKKSKSKNSKSKNSWTLPAFAQIGNWWIHKKTQHCQKPPPSSCIHPQQCYWLCLQLSKLNFHIGIHKSTGWFQFLQPPNWDSLWSTQLPIFCPPIPILVAWQVGPQRAWLPPVWVIRIWWHRPVQCFLRVGWDFCEFACPRWLFSGLWSHHHLCSIRQKEHFGLLLRDLRWFLSRRKGPQVVGEVEGVDLRQVEVLELTLKKLENLEFWFGNYNSLKLGKSLDTTI